jgi:D-serine deaminase-like pyridoxal phosphate-dependent protein
MYACIFPGELDDFSVSFQVGDLLWLIPGHCDPTVNFHDFIVALRNNQVEAVWPVMGRGPGV